MHGLVECPLGDHFPREHAPHAVAAVAALGLLPIRRVPAAHAMQLTAPAADHLPPPQSAQSVAAV